nr:hypothetical protein [Escherichia coli]
MRSLSSPAELCSPTHLVFRRHWIAPSRRGRKEIDRKTWKRLFEETGMDRYWNHKQKKPLTNPFVRIRPSLPRDC